jgi:hypothetical protein
VLEFDADEAGESGSSLSPLPGAAHQLAEEAISQHHDASRALALTLDGIASGITPADAFISVPSTPWYDHALHDVAHWTDDGLHILGNATQPQHLLEDLKTLVDAGGGAASIALIVLSGAGFGAGGALDVTGVGSVLGVPLDVAAAAGVGAGIAGTGYFGDQFDKDIRNLETRSHDSILNDPAYGGTPTDPGSTPSGGEPFDPDVADRVPSWGADGTPKTSGALQTGNGDIIDITSGNNGITLPDDLPPGALDGTGLNARLTAHVEAQAAIQMRMTGQTEGVLYLNNAPCSGCARYLSRYLPSGSTLTLYGPEGTPPQVITGEGPDILGVPPEG